MTRPLLRRAVMRRRAQILLGDVMGTFNRYAPRPDLAGGEEPGATKPIVTAQIAPKTKNTRTRALVATPAVYCSISENLNFVNEQALTNAMSMDDKFRPWHFCRRISPLA